MAWIKCPECSAMISDSAQNCPNCGYPLNRRYRPKTQGEAHYRYNKSDNQSNELNNLYELARRAKHNKEMEDAQKYYELILLKDPYSWEASFYATYCKSRYGTIASIEQDARRIVNSEKSILELIKSTIIDETEIKHILIEISENLIDITDHLFYNAKESYNDINAEFRYKFLSEYSDRCKTSIRILYDFGDNVLNVFGERYAQTICIPCWAKAIALHKQILPLYNFSAWKTNEKNTINNYINKIKKYNPNSTNQPLSNKKRKKGYKYFLISFFITVFAVVFIFVFASISGNSGKSKNQNKHSHDDCMFIGYADPHYPLNGQSHVTLEPQYGYEPVYVYRDDIYNSYHFH